MADDNCPRDNERLLDERHGQHESGEYRQYVFKYESRVERGTTNSTSLKLYIFCIENLHRNLFINFRWGDSTDDTKYFDSLIPPGKTGVSTSTYLGDFTFGQRIIRFKRTYQNGWQAVTRETIYPWGANSRTNQQDLDRPYNNAVLIAANAQAPNHSDHDTSVLTNRDIAALSKNKEKFRKFLDKEGRFELFFSTVVAIPTNLKVSNLLYRRAYKKYKKADFIVASFTFYNTIRNVDGAPRSSIWYKLEPDVSSNRDHAQKILSTLQIVLDLTPSKHRESVPKILPKVERIEKVGVKNILRQPATNLSIAEFQIRIFEKNSGAELASIPAKVFISSDRHTTN